MSLLVRLGSNVLSQTLNSCCLLAPATVILFILQAKTLWRRSLCVFVSKHYYVPSSVPCGLTDSAPSSLTFSIMDIHLVCLAGLRMKASTILMILLASITDHIAHACLFVFRNTHFAGGCMLKGWIRKAFCYFFCLALCMLRSTYEHSWYREKIKRQWWNKFLLPVVEIKTFCDL